MKRVLLSMYVAMATYGISIAQNYIGSKDLNKAVRDLIRVKATTVERRELIGQWVCQDEIGSSMLEIFENGKYKYQEGSIFGKKKTYKGKWRILENKIYFDNRLLDGYAYLVYHNGQVNMLTPMLIDDVKIRAEGMIERKELAQYSDLVNYLERELFALTYQKLEHEFSTVF